MMVVLGIVEFYIEMFLCIVLLKRKIFWLIEVIELFIRFGGSLLCESLLKRMFLDYGL